MADICRLGDLDTRRNNTFDCFSSMMDMLQEAQNRIMCQ